jgi:hypothetical protein
VLQIAKTTRAKKKLPAGPRSTRGTKGNIYGSRRELGVEGIQKRKRAQCPISQSKESPMPIRRMGRNKMTSGPITHPSILQLLK